MRTYYEQDLSEKKLKQYEKLAKLYPDYKIKYWACLNILKLTAWGTRDLQPVDTLYWAVYTPEQNGYKTALKHVPYFYEEDIRTLSDIPAFDYEKNLNLLLNG